MHSRLRRLESRAERLTSDDERSLLMNERIQSLTQAEAMYRQMVEMGMPINAIIEHLQLNGTPPEVAINIVEREAVRSRAKDGKKMS